VVIDFDEEADLDYWPPERPTRSDPSVCQSVHGAYHALNQRLQAAMRQHGLGTSEAMLLAYLVFQSGCSASVVRHALGLHRSTLSSLLDRLEEKDFVHRAPDAFDGRRLEIELTPAGRTAAAIAKDVIRDIEAELAAYTSPAQRRGAEAVFAACTAMIPPEGLPT
jgi:DNA-binding MarR family transcriptional regulator